VEGKSSDRKMRNVPKGALNKQTRAVCCEV
jgi:hypothetical protein